MSQTLPLGYQEQCPACGSTNIHSWERGEGENAIGGKDCRKCGAASRRWQGKGTGRAIWVTGPNLKPEMSVQEANLVLTAA
jgi:hypothetical protein